MFGRKVSQTPQPVTAARVTAKPSRTTPASPAPTATPSVETIVAAVLAALGTPSAKPTATITKASPKATKVKGKATKAASAKPKHLVNIARFDDRAALAAGVDKSTPITAENVAIVAEYIRAMYPNAAYTSLGGAKSAVRQMLRVQGRLTRENLLTAWNAVKADFR